MVSDKKSNYFREFCISSAKDILKDIKESVVDGYDISMLEFHTVVFKRENIKTIVDFSKVEKQSDNIDRKTVKIEGDIVENGTHIQSTEISYKDGKAHSLQASFATLILNAFYYYEQYGR